MIAIVPRRRCIDAFRSMAKYTAFNTAVVAATPKFMSMINLNRRPTAIR